MYNFTPTQERKEIYKIVDPHFTFLMRGSYESLKIKTTSLNQCNDYEHRSGKDDLKNTLLNVLREYELVKTSIFFEIYEYFSAWSAVFTSFFTFKILNILKHDKMKLENGFFFSVLLFQSLLTVFFKFSSDQIQPL